jgi:hypothetical protein
MITHKAQVSVVRISTFILQTLSSHKNYCDKLNAYFECHSALPVSSKIPHFKGTYADYLILVIQKKKKKAASK